MDIPEEWIDERIDEMKLNLWQLVIPAPNLENGKTGERILPDFMLTCTESCDAILKEGCIIFMGEGESYCNHCVDDALRVDAIEQLRSEHEPDWYAINQNKEEASWR